MGNDPVNFVDLFGLEAVRPPGNGAGPVDPENEVTYTKYGLGFKGAVFLGVGLEIGLVVDSSGGFGVYGTISGGVGVQTGMPSSSANIVKKILGTLRGVNGSSGSGSVSNAAGSSTTVDIGVGISGTWDLDSDVESKPNGLGGVSFGGGVWKSTTGVYIFPGSED